MDLYEAGPSLDPADHGSPGRSPASHGSPGPTHDSAWWSNEQKLTPPVPIKVEDESPEAGPSLDSTSCPSPIHETECKGKNKRRSMSLKEKLEIIEEIELGNNRMRVAESRNLPRSTVFSIWKTRHKIKLANAIQGRHDSCKRLRPSGYDDVDQALYRWWLHARNKDMNISTNVLIEKANSFASSLGIQFKNTGSWMDRFKMRHGLRPNASTLCDSTESDNVYDSFVKELPSLTRGRHYRDIYCVNDIGLFYHVLPGENQIFGGYDNVGSDKRVTILIGSNMDGSDILPPLVIGNSETLSGFENMESLSVSYAYNELSHLTVQIWHDWIRAFDRKMYSMRRKVILFSDASPLNFDITGLKAVVMKSVPANGVPFMPVKQGILQRFKSWYRKLILRDMLESINDGIAFHIDLLSVLHFVRKAWAHITEDCVLNSYKLAGWTWDENYGDNIRYTESLPPSISLECLKLNISESIFDDIDAAEEIMITREELTDEAIVESVSSQIGKCFVKRTELAETFKNVEYDYGDIQTDTFYNNDNNVGSNGQYLGGGGTESQGPDISEAKNALETLQAFLASIGGGEAIFPTKAPPRKRKRKPRKKAVEEAKVMSLNPEKGVFEMTVPNIKGEAEEMNK